MNHTRAWLRAKNCGTERTSSLFFDNVESYRSLVIDHQVDKDLAVLTSIAARRVTIPGFSAWWMENTSDYAEDFIAWIDDFPNGA